MTPEQRAYKKRYVRHLVEFAREIAYNRGCAMCGAKENLTWHHRDPSLKLDKINNVIRHYKSCKKLMEELEKCQVLCRACHDEIHSQEKTSGS